MGMRRTVSFKGTEGIRIVNGGNLMGRKISTAWGFPGTGKIARARRTKKPNHPNIFRHRLTRRIL
jgi:hypothetical protein